MIRKLFFLLLTVAALLPLSAGLCEPSEVELLVDLPADAVLETDLLFEDGSFSRLYTLPGGGTLSLLRWMALTPLLTSASFIRPCRACSSSTAPGSSSACVPRL